MTMELKPCPFCNSNKVTIAERVEEESGELVAGHGLRFTSRTPLYVAKCETCNIGTLGEYIKPEYAADAWNLRVTA